MTPTRDRAGLSFFSGEDICENFLKTYRLKVYGKSQILTFPSSIHIRNLYFLDQMFIRYNANPIGRRTSDCVIRAISLLTGMTWDETYIDIFNWGFFLKDVPPVNRLWGSYLRAKGFSKFLLPDTCPDCYTIRQFCSDYPYGRYLLATGTHVVAVIDGNYYDTWDSGDEVPISIWIKEI